MGGGRYTEEDWKTFSTSRGYDKATRAEDIFGARGLHEDLDPKSFGFRESRDSDDNPNSTPIVLGLDVTGSMSPVLKAVAQYGMKTLCEEILNRKPVTDPHICELGIGDVLFDRAPFQASQFEADVRIFEQLEKLFLEQGGGGNRYESYILAWYFAHFRTSIDSFDKRGQKGYLFTIGDEECTPEVSSADIERHLGDKQSPGYTAKQLFDLASERWEIFHVILKQGSHAQRAYDSVKESWDSVIGKQRVLPLDDYTKLGETIVSLLEVLGGKGVRDVTNSWSDTSTSVTVSNALAEVEAMNSNDGTALAVDEVI